MSVLDDLIVQIRQEWWHCILNYNNIVFSQACIRKGAFLKNVKYLNKLEAFVCGHKVLCTCFAALQPD